MNRDLFLSILALDSYNRGYANGVTVPGLNSKLGTADIGVDSSILRDENSSRKDIPAGFFAQSYSLGGGLAGYIGSVSGIQAITFDSFERLAA